MSLIELMQKAQGIVEEKCLWKRFIDGTPLANDIAVWMAEFARAEIDNLTAERDQYKTWWERDSRGLGNTLNELSLLRADKQDQHAKIQRYRRALEELCRRGRCPIAEEALGLDKRYPQ